MIQKWVLVCGFLGICGLGICQDYTFYINQYKSIAVAEMMRTGIPASIKLAQAMLESNCGKSDLACKANNHFGIKCGGDWNGKCFQKEDDDYVDGKLVKSCFREFATVYDSYVAHSDFLTDPAKANRYGALFQLETTDYKSWAKGLARAGYATDPQYANRLMDIIEKYRLFELDAEIDRNGALATTQQTKSHHSIRYQNDVKYIVAAEGDNPMLLAAQLDLTPRRLIKYNDDIKDEHQLLVAGSYVYLQPKRNKYNGHQQYHMLKADEDLVAISQKYGIKLTALLKRNRLAEGQILLPNQKLMLKGKLRKNLRFADPYKIPEEKDTNENNETVSKTVEIEMTPSNEVLPVNEIKVDSSEILPSVSTSVPSEHIVSKGETLFGIARSCGLSVTELKKLNNLSADTINIGQKLVVK